MTAITNRLHALHAWKETLWSTYVRLESKSNSADFFGNVDEFFRGTNSLSIVQSTMQLTERTVGHIRADAQEVLLIAFQLDGQGMVSQDDRVALTRPGEFVFYDSTRPYKLAFQGPFKQLVLRASHETLQARMRSMRNLNACTFQSREGSSGMALDFLKCLAKRAHEMKADELQSMAEIANDLIIEGIISQANDLPPRHRLFERLYDILSSQVRNPEFGPSEFAALAGLSPRSLRRLCAEHGASPVHMILHARLRGARRDLAMGSNTRKSITEIALCWGFNDISHFNRTFKAAFGYTPSTWRRMQD